MIPLAAETVRHVSPSLAPAHQCGDVVVAAVAILLPLFTVAVFAVGAILSGPRGVADVAPRAQHRWACGVTTGALNG